MSSTNSSALHITEKSHGAFVYLWCALLVVVAAHIFWGVWSFYFTGDDFTFLSAARNHNVFRIDPRALHYVPFAYIVGAFPGILVGPNPLLDNILLIAFYLIAVLLTIHVVHMATTDMTTSLAAGFLFLTYANNHEIMFWKTGRITSAVVILCLLSFVLFARYLKSRDVRQLFLLNILLFMAVLTLEQACFIIPVWLSYELMFEYPLQKGNSAREHLTALARLTRKYVPPLMIVMSIFWLKIYHGQAIQPGSLRLKPLIVEGIVYGIFDYNRLLSSFGILSFIRAWVSAFPLAVLVAIIAFLLVVIVACRPRGRIPLHLGSTSRNAGFFLLWGFITYLPLFAIMGRQSRYFGLASIGIAGFTAILLRAIGTYAGTRLGRFQGAFSELISLALVLLVSVPGIRLLAEAKGNWHKASEVEHNLVDSYRFHTANLPQDTTAYVFNLPDRLFFEDASFFIARNGFITEVSYYDKRPITLASIGVPVQSKYPVLQDVQSMGFCDVLNLSKEPDNLILIFDRATERLRTWNAFSSPDANEFVASDSGFYQWEYDSNKHVAWRWTKGSASLIFDFGCCQNVRRLDGLTIELAGSPYLPLHPVVGVGNEELNRFEINHRDLRPYQISFSERVKERIKNQRRIEFWITSETWRPSDYGLSPDYRQLGVAVGDLKFITESSESDPFLCSE